ncbi:MAG: TetR/AcrR family transcriptional regulator [Myxococcota bacterium]
MDAAERCIGRSGLRGTGLAEVAAEADVSRPTAYRLFPGGRSEVIAATIARSVEAFNRAMVKRLDPIDDPLDVVIEGIIFMLREIPQDPVLAQALSADAIASLSGDPLKDAPLIFPGREILTQYRKRVPGLSKSQQTTLWELATRLGLSALVLGTGDELMGAGRRARTKLRAWLGPLVREHVEANSE